MFGLPHLSALITTDRTWDDVASNVLVSACYGAALAAFQYRFQWIWPLMLIHATADFTTILTPKPLPDVVVAVTLLVFLALAVALLRGRPRVVLREDSRPAVER